MADTLKALTWRQSGVNHVLKLLPGEKIGTLSAEIEQEVRESGGKISEKVKAIRAGNITEIRRLQKPEGKDITSVPIRQWEAEIAGKDRNIPVTFCRPETEKEARGCVLYFHGGGFQYGNRENVQPVCRYLSEQADVLVVNPEYRLAPEHKWPAGFEDCWSVLLWVYDHAEELMIDRHRITVAGDSAGGNLAALCSHKDRNGRTGMISKQILYYAALAVRETEGLSEFHFDLNDYIYDDSEKALIEPRIQAIYLASKKGMGGYVPEGTDARRTDISPLWDSDFGRLPETLLITAQYDYLTQQSRAYALKLAAEKVPVTLINYCGVAHAFVDRCGIYPQADDSIREAAEFLKRNKENRDDRI
jgi:acetyl esterase